MNDLPADLDYKDRTIILRVIGGSFLAIGLLAAILGPIEMYCFYLFSEGGMFEYEGFRFGSFMFANLAAQIQGYYFIAAALIPIGYGTLKLRSWARHLTLALVRFWIVAGIPLSIAFFFVLLSSKDISLPFAILAAVALLAAYFLLPWIARGFYRSTDTRLTFESRSSDSAWVEKIPVPVLAIGYVGVFTVLVLHTQIFLNGIFPLFGKWLTGLPGISAITAAMFLLIVLLFAMVQIRKWAWWCVLVYYCTLALSYVITFCVSSWGEILAALNLPAFELERFRSIPIRGYDLGILIGVPFVIALVSIWGARKHFEVE